MVLVSHETEGVLVFMVEHIVRDGQSGHTRVEAGHADGLVIIAAESRGS